MINTYNESHLHKTLKTLIAEEHNCRTEIKLDNYICDAVAVYTSLKRGDFCDIYEIQTHNLGKLCIKIQNLLLNHNVHIVYPLPIKSYIETYSENGEKISRRKSPNEKNIYHLFDELTGIYPLLNPVLSKKRKKHKFELEVIKVITTQKRIATNKPVQLANKSRRWKKKWYKEDTLLSEITERCIFSSPEDYMSLLPQKIPSEFTVKDVFEGICNENHIQTKHQINEIHRLSGKMVWTLRKAELITVERKKGNAFVYKKMPSKKEDISII